MYKNHQNASRFLLSVISEVSLSLLIDNLTQSNAGLPTVLHQLRAFFSLLIKSSFKVQIIITSASFMNPKQDIEIIMIAVLPAVKFHDEFIFHLSRSCEDPAPESSKPG